MARVFFSYAHDDEQYRDQLEKHLSTLKHQGLIESWHDRRLLAGTDFADAIDQELERADVILLLISASFLASRYCYGIEMTRAMERHTAGAARVIPVIVRTCDWQHGPLAGLLAAPRDGKPIVAWSNYDEAYTDVARQVREVIQTLSAQHSASPKRTPVTNGPRAPSTSFAPPPTGLPRSSNLRLKKSFSDADTDQYLHEAFDFLARFFEGSLAELQQRNPGIEGRFRKLDANSFTAVIYRDGKKAAECAISIGGGFSRESILYSQNAVARGNSFNEALSVAHDDQMLYLKTMGMSFRASSEAKLSHDQAADLYWGMLISGMQ